jgi:hypothetical protein
MLVAARPSRRDFRCEPKAECEFVNMNRRSEKPKSDPWIAKVLFGLLLTVLVIGEAVLFSGVAIIPESWPLG